MKLPRWACSEALTLAFASLLSLAPAARAADGVVRIDTAEFVLSDSATPPPDSAPWQPVSLPDPWSKTRPGVHGVGWYRLHWQLDGVPTRPQALYLPWMRATDETWINGVRIGGPAMPSDDARSAPRLVGIDTGILLAGNNVIELRKQVPALWANTAAALEVGDAAALRTACEQRMLLVRTGPHALFGLALLLGLAMLLLWTRRRDEVAFGCFGLASLAYAVWLLDWVVATPLLPLPAWMTVLALTSQTVNVATFVFALRYGGVRWPRIEKPLWLSVLVVAAAESAAYGSGAALPIDVTTWLQAPVCLGYVLVFGWIAWRRRTAESLALLVASPGCALFFLIDWFGIGSFGFASDWLPYSFVVLFLTMGTILVNRFAKALGESELLNAELELRVEAKHAELERNYAQMAQMTRRAAVVEERQRIMSDMHDGIGGQLISTLGLVERGEATPPEVAAALRECIDDLRLAIDSLEPADDDLLPLLGNLRYRLEGRLKASGIALDWQVREVPKLACLTPQNVLHVLRILQEAFTNVLKHAQATCIRVATAVDERQVSIDVSDDGRGFDAERSGAGHGLASMRRRAQAIGGDLTVQPSPSGTTLSLLLPVG